MSATNWVDALSTDDLPRDDVTAVTVAGRDGEPTCAPVTEPLRSHPVKIEGGRVFLQLG